MTKATAPELAIMRQEYQWTDKYISVAPRTSLYTARVNGTPSRDSQTGGIYQITYDGGSGTLANVKAGMTIDVGSAAGLADVGKLRVRKTPTSSIFYIGEVAPGKCQVIDDQYITIREEYLVWQKRWRIVTASSNATYINSFTQYKDYEVAFSSANLPPIANIVKGLTADGEYLPVRISGWNDSGQTYRTVVLRGVGIAVAKSATITGYSWSIDDGTLVSGTLSSQSITVRFPASKLFRYIKLTVTDSNGKTGEKVYPIFVHSAANPPLKNFDITRDERNEGRSMAFEFFGDPDEASTSIIPEGALIVYWEDAYFDGDDAPDPYIGQFMGWARREVNLLKPDADTYTLEVVGGPLKLDAIEGPNDLVTYSSSPNRWNLMSSITVDRLIAYDLIYHSTYPNICNLKLSGLTEESKEESIDQASLWQQVKSIAGRSPVEAYCDSLGGITLKRHPSFATDAEFLALIYAADLSPTDWTYDTALALTTELEECVGLIELGGKNWDGTTENKYLARAPGRLASSSPSKELPRGILLPTTDGLDFLLVMVGDWWEWLNNPQPDIPIELLDNMDIFEPGDILRVSYSIDSLRGTTLTNQRYVVKSVTVQHNRSTDQPDKLIRLSVEKVTRGSRGQQQPIATNTAPTPAVETPDTIFPGLTTPTPPAQVSVNPVYGNGALAFFDTLRTIRRTANFYTHSSVGGPNFDNVSLTAIGMGGTENVLQFVVDASSFGTGALAGWLATTTKIWKIASIFGTPSLTQQLSTSSSTECNIDFDWTHPGDVGKFGVYIRVGTGDHLEVYVTTDGTNWTLVKTFGGTMPNGVPALWIDTHQAGTAWMFAKDTGDAHTYLYKMTGYGSLFAKDSTIYDDTRSGQGAVMPYLDSSSTRVFHNSWVTGTGPRLMRSTLGSGMVHIPLTHNGTDYGPRNGRWGMSIANGNRNKLLVMVTSSSGKPGAALVNNPESSPSVQWISPPSTINYTKGVLLDPNGIQAILMGEDTNYWLGYWDGNTLDPRNGDLTGNPDFIGLVGNG